MRKRISVLSIIWILSLVILVSVKAEAQEILHLGATVPFSWRMGIELKNILEMNADLLNKAGGLTVGGKTYMIKYHIYDDKYNADAGRAAHERLVFEDKVKFIVGTIPSPVILSSLGITEPNKIPIFSNAASEKLLSPDIKYFVHTYYTRILEATAKMVHELRPEIKTVVLTSYDNETGHSIIRVIEKGYKAFGITPLASILFKPGESDFSRIATKVISLKPDHFDCNGATGAENIQLIKALRDAGYKGTITAVYMTQPVVDDLVGKVGKEGAEGIYVSINDTTLPAIKNRPPGILEFRKNYETYYGKWETDALMWSDCWYAWLTAVKKANSIDPDKVVGVIRNGIEVSSPNGVGKFYTRPDLGNKEYCDYAQPVRLGVVKDGKITFVAEKDADYAIDAVEKVYGMKMRK
jgi:ABC-type branched-subunit amino acid transport system substrate-binding protein